MQNKTLKNLGYALIMALYTPLTALAQSAEEMFGEIESKGSVFTEFLTEGYFAFIVVTISLVWVVLNFIQGRMEWQRGITIVIASIVLGNIPKIAAFLIS